METYIGKVTSWFWQKIIIFWDFWLFWEFFDDYSSSPYLVLTRKNPSRKALVRFRISSHQLRIETGRYENIPRNERICHFCTSNKIEDENHFLLDCKAYSQIRDIFLCRSRASYQFRKLKELIHGKFRPLKRVGYFLIFG